MKVKTLIGYIASGVFSFVIDLAVFTLLDKYVFNHNFIGAGVQLWSFLRTFGAAGIARIISCMENFVVNKLLVFKRKGNIASSAGKYTILAVAIYVLSSFSVSVGRQILPRISPTVIKTVTDSVLAVVNFVVQRVWVFRREPQKSAASAQ